MEFKKLKIDTLIPASYNPRKALKPGDPEFEKIKNSITEFGYVDPIIVNSDMTIIGGHQRWSVLKTLGFTEVDCVVIEIDKTKEKALNIALNKVTGEWNKELLADLIKDLQSLDYDVSFTGFDPPEIDELFNDVHSKDTKEDDFDVDKALTEDSIRVLKTDAPFLADRLLEVKNSIWTEVLTYLGIANTMVQKKERLIRDEVQTTMGGTFANRFSALGARQQACKLINDMFGLDVWVDFRSDETIPSRADVNPVTGELIEDIDKSTDNNGIEEQTDLTNVNRQEPNEMRDKK